MADSPADVVNKELHPQAVELIKRYTGGFAESLILQAKILAHQRQHDMVLRSYGQKTRNRLDSGVYAPAIAQVSGCLLPTPSRILNAN